MTESSQYGLFENRLHDAARREIVVRHHGPWSRVFRTRPFGVVVRQGHDDEIRQIALLNVLLELAQEDLDAVLVGDDHVIRRISLVDDRTCGDS
jgi:hypothetical protein